MMDTAQTIHEKRSIKVKDFLDDFRSGMPDRGLMDRYELSATGLEKFYNMLLDRNIIDIAEFEDRVADDGAPVSEGPIAAEEEGREDLLLQTAEPADADIEGPETVVAAPFASEADVVEEGPSVTGGAEDFLRRLDDEWKASALTSEQSPDETRFICPSCLYSQEGAFETCPDCGIAINDFFDQETADQLARIHAPETVESELVFAEDAAPADPQENEMVFSDEDLFPGTQNDFSADDLSAGPIELPLSDEPVSKPFIASPDAFEHDDFFFPAGTHSKLSAFADAADDALPAFPIADEKDEKKDKPSGPQCVNCSEALEPEVRRVYDRKGAMSAFGVAVVSLVFGCLGAAALAIFEEYSLIRVVLIYATGLTMLLGTIFLGLALFMLFFAQEKVYVCTGCHRTYPRL